MSTLTDEVAITHENVLTLPLPDLRKMQAAGYRLSDKVLSEVEQDVQDIASEQFPTAQFLTGKVSRWQHIKAQMLKRKRRIDRLAFAVEHDFNEKYWASLKMGPRGIQQANGFAFEERKAAVMSKFFEEHTRLSLLKEAATDLERAIREIDAHMWGVKNVQQVVKMEHDDAKYASTKDYIG